VQPIYEQPWFGIVIGVIAGSVGLAIWLVSKRRDSTRGFEVKLNTGEELVLKKERETDHG
jgi:hypothetical protein